MRADNDFGAGESSRTRLADGEEGLGETNPPECTIIGSSRPTETFADFGRPDRKGPQQPNFRWQVQYKCTVGGGLVRDQPDVPPPPTGTAPRVGGRLVQVRPVCIA